ncbi:MAG: hypothetical protein JWP97_2370 [Labilithrix sp.]|nr:hypothetical protein [Labilithrix sp.]
MIWIWLLTRHSHKWATGPLERYFAFVCAQCHATTNAMVRSFGHGSGKNHLAAVQAAENAAHVYAFRATGAAACPCCGALQPQALAQFQEAARRAAWRRKWRFPATLVAAAIVLFLVGIAAVRDARESLLLFAVALSASLAAAGLFFAIWSRETPAPATNPFGVWFSREATPTSGSWFPAQPAPFGAVPVIAQPPRLARVLGVATAAFATVSAITALALWSHTFRDLHVVSAEGEALTFTVDDGPDTWVAQESDKDAPTAHVEVRTGRTHHVVVKSPDGTSARYELDPAVAPHGWLVARRHRERGLCLADLTWYYGTPPKDDGTLRGQDTDLVILDKKYDFLLQQPPSTVQTENGSSATRSSLRAYDCDYLAREQQMQFKAVPHALPLGPRRD